jgi:hypothetical protein
MVADTKRMSCTSVFCTLQMGASAAVAGSAFWLSEALSFSSSKAVAAAVRVDLLL